MSDLNVNERIQEANSYFDSGAVGSASATLKEISNELFQSLYPISLPGKPATKSIVHYTSLDTLFSILDPDKPGYLRLYDTINSNDPTEGIYFRDYFQNHLLSTYTKLRPFILNSDPGYTYISSFVQEYESRQKRDKLAYWVAYGRNGYGCSIAIPYLNTSFDLPILRIQYGDLAIKRTVKKLNSSFSKFSVGIQKFIETAISKGKSPSPFNVFSMIPFFHKPSSYSYEAECRILLSPDHRYKNQQYELKYTSAGIPIVRHYVEPENLSLTKIFVSGSVITLGPSIPQRENVRRAVKALLKHHHLAGPDVVFSKIPYRPTLT